jgi:hypothetical protein
MFSKPRFSTLSLVTISILAFCILFVGASFGAVEIVIEYNVTQVCTGSVQLNMAPSIAARGASVTPSASGLNGCDTYRVYFKSTSCSGTTVSQCDISTSGTGCTGTTFLAPSTLGSFNYYACVDISKDSDFADAGESALKVLNVTSTPPTASPIQSGSNVYLTAGGSKNFNLTTTVTDTDGFSDISSCRGYLWNSTASAPLTLAKAMYTNSSCQLVGCAGNACQCRCSFSLMYYDASGTWTANMTIADAAGNTITQTGSFFVNTLASVEIYNYFGKVNATNPGIQFSQIYVGDTNRASSSNPLKFKNMGNVKMSLNVSGTDHVGTSDPTWVIKTGNMTYNSSATGLGALRSLNAAPAAFYPAGGIPVFPITTAGIPEQATFYLNNYLSIPAGWKAQAYSGTLILEMGSV